MSKKVISLIVFGVVALVMLIGVLIFFKTETVLGHEVGVLETWTGGVQNEILTPRTYFFSPGFLVQVIKYDCSSQVFEMSKNNAYPVQSSEGQTMRMELNLRWRLDPQKVISVHKTVRTDIEEKVVRPVLLRVVKDKATTRKAIDAYSGEGLVSLQNDIQKGLIENQDYLDRGIVVENFVIQHIDLDPAYSEEISKKQIAIQRELRASQEEKAALAEAKKAKAEAQANYEKSVVEAERDKQVGVLEAEKTSEQEVLRAEAQKKKTVLEAEAEKEAGILRAQGIIALGEAEAKTKRLQMEAYSAAGAERFVQMEISKNMSQAFQNIRGYLPESMKINVLSESFDKGIRAIMGAESTNGQE